MATFPNLPARDRTRLFRTLRHVGFAVLILLVLCLGWLHPLTGAAVLAISPFLLGQSARAVGALIVAGAGISASIFGLPPDSYTHQAGIGLTLATALLLPSAWHIYARWEQAIYAVGQDLTVLAFVIAFTLSLGVTSFVWPFAVAFVGLRLWMLHRPPVSWPLHGRSVLMGRIAASLAVPLALIILTTNSVLPTLTLAVALGWLTFRMSYDLYVLLVT